MLNFFLYFSEVAVMHQNAQEEVVVAQVVVHQIVQKIDLDHRVEDHHEKVDLVHENPVHVQEVVVEVDHLVDRNVHVVEVDVDRDPKNLVQDQDQGDCN